MIDIDVFSKITYGLYIVCSGDQQKGNGFVSNTVFQVTSQPARFAVCCNKDNYTTHFIETSKAFSISVLAQSVSSELIGRFGYKSGRDVDKLASLDVVYGETGVPIVKNESLAFLECKLIDKFDVGTHWIFVGDLVNAEIIDAQGEPLTYAYYHQVKKGVSPKNAPTYIDPSLIVNDKKSGKMDNQKSNFKKFRCTACGYIYDEAVEKVPFADLPDDWECPVCGTKKSEFEEIA